VTLRAARRAVTLGLALFYCLLRFWFLCLTGRDSLERRAQWQHQSALLVMGIFGIRLRVTGNLPRGGLMVSNHLSYLDILVFSAALPVYLVSKVEIGSWPFFGTLARAGGALFVDRSSRASAEATTERIAERLRGPVPVLFFPEGTSTDGTGVLRFHSRFFIPAVDAGLPVTAAAVRYVASDGSPESNLCWFGDAAFVPHLLKLLAGPDFAAEIHFGEAAIYENRRIAAQQTHDAVEAMRANGGPVGQLGMLQEPVVQ
jgi:1-acyl-sn-glycerol-3-phosphate acyltransferase